MSSKPTAPATSSGPATAASATSTSPATAGAGAKGSAPARNFGRAWLVAAVGIALLAAIAAWWQLQVYAPDQAMLVDAQADVARALARLTDDVEALRARVDAQEAALAGHAPALADVRDALDALDQRLTNGAAPVAQSLRLARIEHDVAVADTRLRLARDLPGATLALSDAAALLDPEIPVEAAYARVLAAAQAALAAVQQPDVVALAARWATHAEEVPALRWRDTHETAAGSHETETRDTHQTGETRDTHETDAAGKAVGLAPQTWKDLLAAVWGDLRGLIEVRRVGSVHEMPGDPAQHALLKGALQIEIATLRAALHARDTAALKSALTSVEHLLARYFDTRQATVIAMRADLAALANLELAPPLPPLKASLDGLRELRGALREANGPAPVSPSRPEPVGAMSPPTRLPPTAPDAPHPQIGTPDDDMAPLPAGPRDIM